MAQPPIEEFQEAIRAMHGCGSRHVGTEHVIEVFNGRTAWEGPVQVFDLEGHPEASRAYAWAHGLEGGQFRFAAVLHGGGVDGPASAVQAYIVAEAKRREIDKLSP